MDIPIPKILMVDDRTENLLALESLLDEFDIEIIKATSGPEALKQSYRHDFALILLDVQMPGMDGYETATMLRAIEKTRYVPIIFVTAISHTEEHLFKGYESGAVDYLFKPIASEVLKSKVKVFIHLDQQNKKLLAQTVLLKEKNRQLQQERDMRADAEEQVRKALSIIEEQQKIFLEELRDAKDIQNFFLPAELPLIDKVTIASRYISAELIGGDLFDVTGLSPTKAGLMIADVTGHGIPAALLSSIVSYIFKHNVRNTASPGTVLRNISRSLRNYLPKNKFATLFYGIFDSETRVLTYLNAGHPPPIVIRNQSHKLVTLEATITPLGMPFTDSSDFDELKIQLYPGDKLLMYTDAIIDVMDENAISLGMAGLKQFIKEHSQLNLEVMMDNLYQYGLRYSRQEKYEDDFTMLALEL
ncbi:MAG: fused response regulator/phosphatase [SAR324 cluster bacterium]|nr:fused response regulator/phosphatase [SAR324 cluster bacterium]